jgi:hypothetical protein
MRKVAPIYFSVAKDEPSETDGKAELHIVVENLSHYSTVVPASLSFGYGGRGFIHLHPGLDQIDALIDHLTKLKEVIATKRKPL